MTPFDADKITKDNFEGFRPVVKKPIVVYALQMNFPEGFTVTTPSGKVQGEQGDYLMIGFDGEKYPCKKEIFEMTYVSAKERPLICVECGNNVLVKVEGQSTWQCFKCGAFTGVS